MTEFSHKPVLLNETVDGLMIKPGGVYADGTLGGGGHAYAVCEKLGNTGKYFGIDRDDAAIKAATARLAGFGELVTIVKGNYRDMKPMLIVTGSIKKVYHHRFLRRYVEELWKGKIESCDRVFSEALPDKHKLTIRERYDRQLINHPVFIDNDAKIEVAFLRCRLALLKNDVETAYEILQSIDQNYVYPEEWAEVLVKKAQCLAWMGNITTAKTALELAGIGESKVSPLSQSPEVWITLALISELSGEFDKAYDYAVKAKDFVELSNLPEERKAIILNDCARYEIIHDSRLEADRDINNAWKHIEKSNMITREVIAVNVIQVMLEYGYSEKAVIDAFEKYKEMHHSGDITADINYFNTHVTIMRQFSHKEECYDLIKQFYTVMKSRVGNTKGLLECIKATVFHQLMDGEYDYTWLDTDIVVDPEYYKNLSVYERTFIFKHYYEVLSQARFKYVRLRKPYAELYNLILGYYNGTSLVLKPAIDDIEDELRNIKEYNVFRHTDLMQRKLFVLAVRDKRDHIKKNLQQYIDLNNYLENQGLRVEAINIGVQIVIDASKPENTPMTNIISGETITYSEYNDNAPVVFPRKDGIFIKYEDIIPAPWIVPGDPDCTELIREYTVKAIEDIRELQNHPIKAELSIKLIKPCLALGMDTETKELYSYATKTGRSDDALALWARVLLQDVRRQYGDQSEGLGVVTVREK